MNSMDKEQQQPGITDTSVTVYGPNWVPSPSDGEPNVEVMTLILNLFPYMGRFEISSLIGKRAAELSLDADSYIPNTIVQRSLKDERRIAELELRLGYLNGYHIVRRDPLSSHANFRGHVFKVASLKLPVDF
jgi:hypothetical protein